MRSSGPLVVLVVALAVSILACTAEEPVAPQTGPGQPIEAPDQTVQREIFLYYADSSLQLVEEARTVVLPKDPPLALATTVSELLRGPREAGLSPLFPEDAVVNSAFVLPSGIAVVDLGGASLEEGWQTGSSNEILAIRSTVMTVTKSFPEIRSVQFLIGGSIRATLGGHVDISRPIIPFGG